ncbi:hypothetical protein PAMP_004317 [Pampus punctatissimus]
MSCSVHSLNTTAGPVGPMTVIIGISAQLSRLHSFCSGTGRSYWDDDDWRRSPDCFKMSESECDLTNYLIPFNRMYSADILTEPATVDYTYDLEEFPHTYSPQFNPYTESVISAVKFSVDVVEENKATVTITDPLTGTYQHGKQLTIRDILKNDLKYKISYYKSGSTGKM